MHKYRNSIPAGHYAKQLLAILPDDHTLVTVSTAQGSLTFRRCSRRAGTWGKALCGRDAANYIELTGGAILTATATDPQHLLERSHMSYRLRPGWETRDVERAVRYLHGWQRQQSRLRQWRKSVLKLAESRQIPDDLPETENGHPIEYALMTIEDCEYWLTRLTDFPPKT